MWKRLVTVAAFGLLTSCGPQAESAEDFQTNDVTYENNIDVSYIINLKDFFQGDDDIYKKLSSSNESKSNHIFIKEIGKITLFKQNHFDGNDEYTSIILPIHGNWNGLNLDRVEWGESKNKMWGYYYIYFKENPKKLSNTVNSLMSSQNLNICFNEYLNEIDIDCGCDGYSIEDCGRKLYPNKPVNPPTVEINIETDSNSEEGSILTFKWSS